MIKLICCFCDEPAKYVIATQGNDMSVCGKHSQRLWKDQRPLRNPLIQSWHQELLLSSTVN